MPSGHCPWAIRKWVLLHHSFARWVGNPLSPSRKRTYLAKYGRRSGVKSIGITIKLYICRSMKEQLFDPLHSNQERIQKGAKLAARN